MVVTSLSSVLERLAVLHPKQIDLSLDRIRILLKKLGDPHLELKNLIHVAGTNGKGSTIAFLKAFLEEAGFRVDVYTSPHLVDFNERICLNGQKISNDLLLKHLLQVEKANQGEPITFFEATTVAAFLAFAENKADYVLLETGLGGRLDATNVIEKPVLCLITSLSLDHEEYLGNSIQNIAFEKAGIFKERIPVFAMKSSKEALDVLEKEAQKKSCPIKIEGKDWEIRAETNGFYVNDSFFDPPRLFGSHQFHNAGLAIAGIKYLHPEISMDTIKNGLKKVSWRGRLEKLNVPELEDRFELWIDGGHNPGAGAVLADYISTYWSDQPLHVICGMLQSKDVSGYLKEIAPFMTSFQAVLVPSGTAPSCSPQMLLEKAEKLGVKTIKGAKTPKEAIKRLLDEKTTCGHILICGSLYLLGSILKQGLIINDK